MPADELVNYSNFMRDMTHNFETLYLWLTLLKRLILYRSLMYSFAIKFRTIIIPGIKYD